MHVHTLLFFPYLGEVTDFRHVQNRVTTRGWNSTEVVYRVEQVCEQSSNRFVDILFLILEITVAYVDLFTSCNLSLCLRRAFGLSVCLHSPEVNFGAGSRVF